LINSIPATKIIWERNNNCCKKNYLEAVPYNGQPFLCLSILCGTIIAISKSHNLYKNVVILSIQFMTGVDETKKKENYPLLRINDCIGEKG
jgi:hypothetical protein